MVQSFVAFLRQSDYCVDCSSRAHLELQGFCYSLQRFSIVSQFLPLVIFSLKSAVIKLLERAVESNLNVFRLFHGTLVLAVLCIGKHRAKELLLVEFSLCLEGVWRGKNAFVYLFRIPFVNIAEI